MGVYKIQRACATCLIFFCAINLAKGQSVIPWILDANVKLPNRSIGLDSLIQKITDQTGTLFSYNSKKIKLSHRFVPDRSIYTIRQLLDIISSEINIHYSVIGNQVILQTDRTLNKKSQSGNKTMVTSLKKSSRGDSLNQLHNPVSKLVIPNSFSDGSNTLPSNKTISLHHTMSRAAVLDSLSLNISLSPKPDTSVHSTKLPALQSDSSIVKAGSQPLISKDSLTEFKSSQKKNRLLKKSWLTGAFMDVGVNAEETLFIGATIRGGIPAFFGTASYKSDTHNALYTFGLGTSWKFTSRSRILLTTQYGQRKKDFQKQIVNQDDSTSLTHGINTSSILGQLGTGVEVTIQRNLKLYFGLQMNGLQTKYGADSITRGLQRQGNFQEREISIVYPPYTLVNTHADTKTSGLKIWTGLQVALYYRVLGRK